MQEYRREDLCRVIFNELSERCSESLIYELALQFGPIKCIVWPSEQTLSGVPQRASFCFVDYKHPEDAKYACQVLSKSRVKLLDKEIRVSHLSAELQQREREALLGMRGAAASAASSSSLVSGSSSMSNMWHPKSMAHTPRGLHEVGAKVLVRNVDPHVTEYDIQCFFEQFGAFAAPPRMLRHSSGNFRGLVILSYNDFAFSDRVIKEMNGKVFRDRIITVEYAQLEDGSGRVHGTEEERANAVLIKEEERKYLEKIQQELSKSQDRHRQQNTSWANPVYQRSGKER